MSGPIRRRPERRRKGKWDYQEQYERWWLGKLVRVNSMDGSPKRVASVELYGPPSFVYGDVLLIFEDGTQAFVYCGEAFKPRKSDVTVFEEPDGSGEG